MLPSGAADLIAADFSFYNGTGLQVLTLSKLIYYIIFNLTIKLQVEFRELKIYFNLKIVKKQLPNNSAE